MDPLPVKTFTADHVLDPSDHLCILNYAATANLIIEAGSCPVGLVCFIICPPPTQCGTVNPAREVRVNSYTGAQAVRYLVPGVNILLQYETDSWTFALAKNG